MTPQRRPGRPGFLALGAALLMLGGCGPLPLKPGQLAEREQATQRFAERGYDRGESQHEVSQSDEAWQVAGQTRPVVAYLPRGVERPPLVLYLRPADAPPLAADAWPGRWAAAGYAVLVASMTTAESIEARRQDWRQLLDELVRRAASGVGVARAIDVSRLALAGQAEAAQGALALVGERDPERENEVTPPPASVRAVIALEPPADVARGALANRFGGITRPVLSVVGLRGEGGPRGPGSGDGGGPRAGRSVRPAGPDETGDKPVDRGLAHEAPYHFMPAGDKYLLRLGSAAAGAPHDGAPEREARRGAARRAGAGVAPRGERSAGSWLVPVVAEQVSTAFLDATLRGDAIAREWLQRNAGRWLSPVGELIYK